MLCWLGGAQDVPTARSQPLVQALLSSAVALQQQDCRSNDCTRPSLTFLPVPAAPALSRSCSFRVRSCHPALFHLAWLAKPARTLLFVHVPRSLLRPFPFPSRFRCSPVAHQALTLLGPPVLNPWTSRVTLGQHSLAALRANTPVNLRRKTDLLVHTCALRRRSFVWHWEQPSACARTSARLLD